MKKKSPQLTQPRLFQIGNCLRSHFLVDLCILLILFIAPLFLGGRHPLGRLVFVCAVFLLALIWSVSSWRDKESKLVVSSAFLLPFLGVVICVVQLINLPPALLDWLSPYLKTMFSVDLIETNRNLVNWTTISISPVDTRESLCVYLAYVVLFFVIAQRIQTKADVYRFVSWIAYATIALAVIGLVQYLLPNGRFLWIYAHPTRDTFGAAMGPFVNANHFAHIMAIGLGSVIWLVVRHTKETRRHGNIRRDLPKYLTLAGVCITLLAGLLSYSRAGIGLIGLVIVGLGFFIIKNSRQPKKQLMTFGIPILLCCVALAIHGVQSITSEISSLSTIANNDIGERQTLWKAVGRGITNFGRMGSGAGTHREVYPVFMDRALDREFTHAENGYLQVFMETGILGMAALLGSIFIVVRWSTNCIKTYTGDDRLIAIVISIAITVSLVHSLCDFVWYVPACATWLIFMLAMLFRMDQWTNDKATKTHFPVSRQLYASLGCLSLFLIALSYKVLLPPTLANRHWEDYLTLSIASNLQHSRSPKTGRQREVDAASLDSVKTVRSMLKSLQEVVKYHPAHARAHSRLASLYLQSFDFAQQETGDSMGVTQIRDAAYASKFASRKAQTEWLSVALEDNLSLLERANRHARASLQYCPTQGLSYLYLSELSFLSSPNSGLPRAYIQQAHNVRPTNGAVLFAVGQSAASEGRVDEAFQYWRSAFQLGGNYQKKIIEIFGPQLDARSFIQQFSPSIDGLHQLYSKYEELGRADQNRLVSDEVARQISIRVDRQTMSHAELSDFGLKLRAVKKFDAASDIYQLAYVRAPYNFETRWRLAKSLVDAERYDEAFPHLNWCKRQRPNDKFIRLVLRTVIAKTSLDGRAL